MSRMVQTTLITCYGETYQNKILEHRTGTTKTCDVCNQIIVVDVEKNPLH